MRINEKMNEYRTQNLYEASYLACKGFQFIGKEQSSSKVSLSYKNSEELQKAVIDFYAGGLVSAKQFCDWYRTLKDYVFSN